MTTFLNLFYRPSIIFATGHILETIVAHRKKAPLLTPGNGGLVRNCLKNSNTFHPPDGVKTVRGTPMKHALYIPEQILNGPGTG